MYFNFLLSQLTDLFLLIGKEFLKFLPLFLQILIPIFQEIVLILIFKSKLLLRLKFSLPLIDIVD